MPFRAFVGVPVPAGDAFLRLLDAFANSGADLKLTKPENLHFTLAFIGDVPDDATPALGAALARATKGTAPFRLTLAGTGAFPNDKRPRVLWAGTQGGEPLVALARRVQDELKTAGHPTDDKPFKAHVTLGRTRSPRGIDGLKRELKTHHDTPLGECEVNAVTLYRSTLTPQGPVYETVHTQPLPGGE